MIDYIAIGRNHLGKLRNCKVVPGESMAAQHRLLIADLVVMRKRERMRKRKARTKWWKLKEGQEYIENASRIRKQENGCWVIRIRGQLS